MAKSTSGGSFVYYHYDPSLAAAVIFVVAFFASTTLHVFQLARKRTWYFVPFVIGGIFEFVGYIGRIISHTQTPNWTLGPYIQQTLLILLAPALFAASIYMVLGRIIRLTDGEKHSLVRSTWLTKIFVSGDVMSFLLQATGGGVLAAAKDQDGNSIGQNIIVGGLIVQVVFFGFFIMVAARFHYKISFNPTGISNSLDLPWKRQLLVLYAASALIMIRSIFRVAEYVQGNDGELLTHEVYLYIFDALLMFTVVVMFNIWHPSVIISKETLQNLSHDLEALKKEPMASRDGGATRQS